MVSGNRRELRRKGEDGGRIGDGGFAMNWGAGVGRRREGEDYVGKGGAEEGR